MTPAELYEAANIMLAEMVRIKFHLDITLPRDERRVARNKRLRDVFAELLLVIKNLDALAKAAAQDGVAKAPSVQSSSACPDVGGHRFARLQGRSRGAARHDSGTGPLSLREFRHRCSFTTSAGTRYRPAELEGHGKA